MAVLRQSDETFGRFSGVTSNWWLLWGYVFNMPHPTPSFSEYHLKSWKSVQIPFEIFIRLDELQGKFIISNWKVIPRF